MLEQKKLVWRLSDGRKKRLSWRLSDGRKQSLHGGKMMAGKKACMEAKWWQEKRKKLARRLSAGRKCLHGGQVLARKRLAWRLSEGRKKSLHGG
jgi:hypothetical protein